jgi:predicted metalloprotease
MTRLFLALLAAAGLLAAATNAAPVAGAESANRQTASSDGSAYAREAIADIQSYWARTMPQVYGRKYDAIPDSRLHPFDAQDPPPACDQRGQGTTPYQEVAGNAFYCAAGDFVAWDVQSLIPSLEKKFGDFAVALVLAHEWGHAIQARTDSTIDATVILENQADCFAGSWAQHVEKGDHTSLTFTASDLDVALGGFLGFRDPPGIDPSQEGAHGNAFDRVSAFQDGFEGGAKKCATYENDPPPVTESGYTTLQDEANGGDVSLADAIKLVHTDLDEYWADELKGKSPVSSLVEGSPTDCRGSTDGGVLIDGAQLCSADETVRYDHAAVAAVYKIGGDFGAGMVLAAEWSSAAEHKLGLPDSGTEGRLTADCLTGSWAGDVAQGVRTGNGTGKGQSGTSQLSLSPGDLDQAITTFVAVSGHDRGTAFSRVAAFRNGFFNGERACTKVTT